MQLLELIDERLKIENTYVDPVLPVNNNLVKVDAEGIVRVEDYTFNTKGLQQMCFWTKIPFNFFNKLSPESKQKVMGEMIEKLGGRELMFRVEKSEVRSVRSPKYRVENHTQILIQLGLVVGFERDVTEAYFHDGLMSIRLTDAMDSLSPGVAIQNSEIGESSVTVAPFIYRKICSNGLVVAKQEAIFRQVHAGKKEYSIEDAINQAFKEASISRTLFEATKNRKVLPDNVLNEITRMSKRMAISKKLVPAIKSCYDEDPMPNGFGIINAFTRFAKSLPLEERLSIEEAAGKILYKYSGN